MYFYPSGIIFGGFMYYLGKKGFLDQLYQHFTQKQKQTEQHQQAKIVQQIVNNTFTNDAITPILRNFEINPKCKITYSTLHKAPLSVHELLDLPLIQGDAERAKYFFPDKNIKPQKFAVKNDHFLKSGAYKNFQLNRGHMAAAGNYSGNQEYKTSTFSFANVIPQNGYNNGGIWNTFERYCRTLLKDKKCDTLEIISGPIYHSQKKVEDKENVYINEEIVLMKNGIIVPPRLYKIIKCNTKDKAYASGFTFTNSKTFDNEKTLLEFQDSIENIQDATGLVFNFKDKLTGKLSQYDYEGLNRTKKVYDSQFYKRLFKTAKNLDEMNQALRRAYEQKINMDASKDKNVQKIQTQGFKQLNELKSNSMIPQCKKLGEYLNLHKSLFYLGGDKERFKNLTSQLQQEIKSTIPECRKVATPQDQASISWKAGYKDRRYQTPFASKLLQLFPNVKNQQNAPVLQKKKSSSSVISQASTPSS